MSEPGPQSGADAEAPSTAPPLRRVWLVTGDDPTLIGEAVRAVVDEEIGTAERSLVVEDHGGEEIDLAAVSDSCRTPPFLSDRRIVIVRDVGRWKTEEVVPLLDYLADPLDTTRLILAVGTERVAPKLLAAVKATGSVVATTVGSRDAAAWLKERVRHSAVHLDAAAESLVESHLGEDLSRLGALLDVIAAAYPDGRRLGTTEIEPYLGEAGSIAPWDLTDAIDRGDHDVALERLHRMLGAGDRHPLVVLATLHRHVAAMVRLDSSSITSEAAAARALGIAAGRSTFPAAKALRAARRLGSAGIAGAICLVADAEVDLKGRSEWPAPLVLEVLVARLCRLSSSGGAVSSRRPRRTSG